METDHDSFKRQLSPGQEMAVTQAPRPSPAGAAYSFQHGSNTLEYAKTMFRALEPPTKDQENKGHHLEQSQPSNNALTLPTLRASSASFASDGAFGHTRIN